MAKKAFVTGATGLLGSHLLLELAREGFEIVGLTRSMAAIQQVEKVFAWNNEPLPAIHWVEGDLSDVHFLIEATTNCDYFFHCAAKVSFDRKDRDELFKVNVEGTANLLAAAQHHNITKFVHTSSTSAIGSSIKGEFVTEKTDWENNGDHSQYGLSKHLAEREVWRAAEEGLKTIIVNPCVIIGPGKWHEGSSALINRVWTGLKFYTKGANAFVDVRNVASNMQKLATSDIVNQRYLLIGENAAYKSLFDKIAAQLQKPAPSILATKWMSSIAWRIEFLKSMFSGKSALITRETARSANNVSRFSADKIQNTLNVEFNSLDTMLEYTCKCYKDEVEKGLISS